VRRKFDNYKQFFEKKPELLLKTEKLANSLKEQAYDFYNQTINGCVLSEMIAPPNELLINEIVINAIVDIDRVCAFHPVKNPTRYKYAAYISYWWLKMRPLYPVIQNEKDAGIVAEEVINTMPYAIMTSVNEIFVCDFIMAVVGRTEACKPCECYESICDNIDDFRGSLVYNLQYRLSTAQQLEMCFKALNICPMAHLF